VAATALAALPAAGAQGGGAPPRSPLHLVAGSPGPDTLLGTKAPDLVVGGAGHDELYGGAGGDILRGGPGKDHLYGGDGDDVLQGGPAHDPWPVDPPYRRERLLGGAGADSLASRIGGAVLQGGHGNDVLDAVDRATPCRVRVTSRVLASGGPACAQWSLAGPGDDVVRARDGNLDFVDCGSGRDRVASADRIDVVLGGCERSPR
jgi:Ca2+-binding RTX toxin-like protein